MIDVVLRGYTYDALARPSARSLARQAATRQDAFAYNTRSEIPRRLGGGIGQSH